MVLQTGNFHFRMGRVCGACGCPILGAVWEDSKVSNRFTKKVSKGVAQ